MKHKILHLILLSLFLSSNIQAIRLFKPAINVVEETDQLFDQFLEMVNKASINTLDELLTTTKNFFERHADQIIECENELARTYESWLKPWHWNKRKRLAHKQINALFSLLIGSSIRPSDNYKKISWIAQKAYGKDIDYPHLHLEGRLYNYMQFVKKDAFFKQIGLPYEIKAAFYKKLQRIYRNLFSHQEYINEKRAFRQEQQLNNLQAKLNTLITQDAEKAKEIKELEKKIVHQ